MNEILHKTISSLKIRNYRIYFFGQIISVSGTFLQAVAQDWLVLKLTNSGTMLGLVLFFQFSPILVFGSFGGVIADRFEKLKILYFTQVSAGVLAFFLGILVITNTVQLWMVFIFAVCLGLINSIDNPTRQSFVSEMVGKEEVKNAIGLWAILISICRVMGPGVAGILIATIGIGYCFMFNAFSYIAVVISLFFINKSKLHSSLPIPHAKGQIMEGIRYVKNTPILFTVLVMMVIIGTITFEWPASQPLFARFVLNGDAGTYSALSVAAGIGMFVGGLLSAVKGKSSILHMSYAAFFLGFFLIIDSMLTNLYAVLVIFSFVGFSSIIFTNLSNSTLQVHSDPKMRGRVMSLWAIAFVGSTAVGGPFIGWVGEYFGARWPVAIGGIAALVASLYGFIASRKIEG